MTFGFSFSCQKSPQTWECIFNTHQAFWYYAWKIYFHYKYSGIAIVTVIARSHEIEYDITHRFEISIWRNVKFCSFGCTSKLPDILINMCRHSISGSVCMIFYHSKWNFISVKVTDMKSIPALSFKRTCALIATSSESALIYFVSDEYVQMKISCRFEISFRSKSPIWNPYCFEFHFDLIHVNTNKELTEHRSEHLTEHLNTEYFIFNRNEISYPFEFISLVMWTYSRTTQMR